MTTDDEIHVLLREIRDIQLEHLEAYRAQSERAISMTSLALRRQRIALITLLAILTGIAFYALSCPDAAEWKAVQDRAQQQLDQADRQWKRQIEDRNQRPPTNDLK